VNNLSTGEGAGSPAGAGAAVGFNPVRTAVGGAIGLGVVALGYLTAFESRSQLFGAFPYRGETSEKVLALTFDDGPNEPYTSQLLDTLDQHGVLATFFQVGRCAQRYPNVTRRIVEGGHVLGNHSYSHSFSRYASQPRQRLEIGQTQRVLDRIAGVRPTLYRPPWLCHWPWVLTSIRAGGLQVVSGTFAHPLEIFQPDAAVLVAGAARRAKPGSMLIFHDGREARGGPRGQSVAAIGPLIDLLRDQGYSFTTVDRLLGVPAYLEPGGGTG
jgi:peptidoglycan/xylan/chitin deacetylase (PgdA/CDA1 family)